MLNGKSCICALSTYEEEKISVILVRSVKCIYEGGKINVIVDS